MVLFFNFPMFLYEPITYSIPDGDKSKKNINISPDVLELQMM